MVDKIKVKVVIGGKSKTVDIDRIFKGEPVNKNYFDARKFAEALGYSVRVDTDGKTPVIER